MTTTEQEFKQALAFVKEGKGGNQPSTKQKLAMYALYKQITEGPNRTPKPKAFDMVAKAKWDAWTKLGSMSKEEAMKQYIAMIDTLSPGWRDASKQQSSSAASTAAPQPATPIRPSVFNPQLMKGKVALVTGGGSGIGKGITEALMAHGCNTVIMGRTLSRLQDTARELNANYAPAKCICVQADVRNYSQIEEAVDKVLAEFGQIDVLINGAAGNFLAPAVTLSSNAFKTVIDIDTVGTFNASRAVFLKAMRPRKQGCIINLSMTLHKQGSPLQVHAGAAKAAIDSMTKQMAVEWGLDGVRLNAIAIGPIDNTEGLKRLMPAEMKKTLISKIPLRRLGTMYDIADTCLFLSSDAASYITGSIVTVDGGSVYTTGGLFYPESLPYFEAMKKKRDAAKAKAEAQSKTTPKSRL